MCRGVYSHEKDDSDFAWLINNYKAMGNKSILIEIPGSPIVLITIPESEEITLSAMSQQEGLSQDR